MGFLWVLHVICLDEDNLGVRRGYLRGINEVMDTQNIINYVMRTQWG